jgi:hypothetical protein
MSDEDVQSGSADCRVVAEGDQWDTRRRDFRTWVLGYWRQRLTGS